MKSVDAHLADILEGVEPLAPLHLALLETIGCVLAEDVVSAVDLPPFDNSSMDGYAVMLADVAGASADAPVWLPVAGEMAAGSSSTQALASGTTVRIMTGAPVPAGAQAVVPQEWTDQGTPAVAILREPAAGANIRRCGEDVHAGDVVLTRGTTIGPTHIGLLAAVGRGRIPVHPQPRVVVFSTGSELVEPGATLEAGQIHDSNSYLLTAAVRDLGAIAYRVAALPDDPRRLLEAIEDQLARADVVVTSGGVSVGAHDVVKEVLSRTGTVEFVTVAMQPGRPQGHGTIGPDRTPILTLPGNPVSAFVSFEVFVRPLLRAAVRRELAAPAHGRRRPDRGHALAGRASPVHAGDACHRGRQLSGTSRRRPRLAPAGRPGAGQRPHRRARGGHRGPGRRRGDGHGAREPPRMSDPSGAPSQSGLTHLDSHGAARMVDVSGKDVTIRTARASGFVRTSGAVVAALRADGVPKGDALAVARIAGIAAAKRTPDLVPLCHPVAIHAVTVDLAVRDDGVAITAMVRTADRTGVEMEALTCVAVAGLALIDMVKALDRAAILTDVRVEEKTGGRSGTWRRG